MSLFQEIIITGGPCSGKTTGLSSVESWVLDRGFRVLIVPEVATILILGGIRDIGKIAATNFELYLNIQRQILRMQLALREIYVALANSFPEPTVIIYDRGSMDGKAYLPKEYFEALLEEGGLQLKDVRDMFALVAHLVTAADGAEEYYTTTNNEARRESPEEARELDLKTRNAWNGHPHIKVIDNSTNFDLKIARLIAAIARSLGIPMPLEIERKYLLKNIDLSEIRKHVDVVEVSITQIYINHPVDGKVRIRKRQASDGSTTYYYTIKRSTGSALVRHEQEKHITATEYLALIALAEPDRKSIIKKRYCFIWKNQYFELDVFQSPPDLVELEIELTEENDKVELPPFIEVIREVTDEPQYSNYNLAKILK